MKLKKTNFKKIVIGVALVLVVGISIIYLLYLGGRLGTTPPTIVFKVPSGYQGAVVLVQGQPKGIEFTHNRNGEIMLDVPTSGLILARSVLTSYNPRFVLLSEQGVESPIAEDTTACKGQALPSEQKVLVACSQIQTKIHNAKPCPQHIAWVICSNINCELRVNDFNEITVPIVCDL